MSLPASDLDPHPLNGSWDSRESAPQTASRSVHAFFAGLTPVPNTDKLQTDSTQTTLCAVCVASKFLAFYAHRVNDAIS